MSILRAFNIGVSGLGATGSAVSVNGDNIANAGTTGFKYSRPEFQDVLATSLKGIDGGDQYGAGTQIAHIKTVMSQGDIARTDNLTDLAINGEGFFAVRGSFGMAYTRDGSMHFDKDGNLVNSDGYRVMGFMADDDGRITGRMDAISVDGVVIPAKSTSEARFLLNLDTRSAIREFDINDVDNTANFTHSGTFYDSMGTARQVTLAYNKIGPTSWQYRALVDGEDLGREEGSFVEAARGRLVFNDSGRLQEEIEETNGFVFEDGLGPLTIKLDFGDSLSEGGTGVSATTQFGSENQITRLTQNGYQAANLGSLSFDEKGKLVAVYTNGISKDLAQIAIAKFENENELFKMGKNLFRESRRSGQPTMGTAGVWGRGEILSRSLELSNVDIAKEFVSLMTNQRNFTANTKSLTTADEMLQEVLSIKR